MRLGDTELLAACDAALAGDWHRAHGIVQQDESGATACWIHAVLHKIEGDQSNSRYWYARAGRDYGKWTDARAELVAIREQLARLP
jgi:hypothetical protein